MVVRRSESRRRRIVVDPSLPEEHSFKATDTLETSAKKGKKESTLYASSAQRCIQSKTTDLIPKRPLWVGLTLIVLIAAVIGLNLLSHHSHQWEPWIGTEGAAAFNLSGQSTLSAWFTSILLVVSGFASLQIYALRQHRRDDYRGSYRLWLWIALLLLIASANCIVDLSTIVTSVVQSLSGSAWVTEPWWWVGIKIGLLSTLVARGLYEIRESKGTIVLVFLVWISYSSAIILQLPNSQGVLTQIETVDPQTIFGNLQIIGATALVMAHFVFARFVYLQALGLIKSKQKTITKPKVKVRRTKAKAKESRSTEKPAVKQKIGKTTNIDSESASSDSQTEAETTNTSETKNKSPKRKPIQNSSKPQSSSPDKAQPSSQPNRGQDSVESEIDTPILKMGKAELRRQRKQNQSKRRAA